MIKKFLAYYRPHYKLFIIDTICSLAIAACNLFYPFVTKELTSRFIPDKNLEMVFIWLGALLVIYIGKAIMSYIVQYWGHIAGVRVQADMRRDFFRHLQRLPFSYGSLQTV